MEKPVPTACITSKNERFMSEDGKAGSYGLHHIEERAIEMGGTSKIVSVPSQGTIVEVKVPVEKGVEPDDTNRTSG